MTGTSFPAAMFAVRLHPYAGIDPARAVIVSSTDARGRADATATEHDGRARAVIVLIGLAASIGALAVAPVVMPPGYSWVSQTTSESAAQGVQGAWVARLGFVLFGLSVILLAFSCRRRWGPWAASLHGAFGALMTSAAAFSHRPWIPGANFDRTEDLLHAACAGATARTASGWSFIRYRYATRIAFLGFSVDGRALAGACAPTR